jgi:hypothetical protein
MSALEFSMFIMVPNPVVAAGLEEGRGQKLKSSCRRRENPLAAKK